MPHIPREIVDTVRERTDIVELISRNVDLKRRGRNYVGLCPFHTEKTPSFNVLQDKGIFHCFGCQEGGDAFKFLMLREGLSFGEAVRELAEAVGIEVAERDLTQEERAAVRNRTSLYDALEAATSSYESQLWTQPAGAEARAYLESRGVTKDTAQRFRIGFAPDGWTHLVDTLGAQGFDATLLAKGGIATARRSGSGHIDMLRNRLVFPITDERGRPVAFGGRLLGGDGPKYINTQDSPVYKKKTLLYAMHAARGAIGRQQQACVVEGYFDVVSLHQAGFDNAVATCGTALTREHLDKLRKVTRDVVLLLDSDEAGMRAAERSLEDTLDAGIQAWRVALPDAKDPDELLREKGPQALSDALKRRQPLFEWVLDRKLEHYGTSTLSRQHVLDDVLPLLRRANDTVLVSAVARRISMPEAQLRSQLSRQTAAPSQRRESEPNDVETRWRPTREVVHALWLAIHAYDHVADIARPLASLLAGGDDVARRHLKALASGKSIANVIQDCSDDHERHLLSQISVRDALYTDEAAARAVLEIAVRQTAPLRAARQSAASETLSSAQTGANPDLLREALLALKVAQDGERLLQTAVRIGDVETAMKELMSLAANPD